MQASPNSASSQGPHTLVNSGRLQVPATWSMRAHRHGFHELVVVVRGEQSVEARGAVRAARPGEVLFYPMELMHREWASGGRELETVYVNFLWDGYRAGMPEYLADREGRILALATWLHAEREAYFPGVRGYRDALLGSVLAEYVRLSVNRSETLVEKVRAHARAHMEEPVGLADLAAVGGLSKYYFVRSYRRLTGLSPMADLRRMRLEAARHLLLTTDLPLKTIAPRVGLADEYYLSRLLRRHFGGARYLRQRAARTAP